MVTYPFKHTCKCKYFLYHAILITVVAPLECDNGAFLRHTLSCCSDFFNHHILAATQCKSKRKSSYIFISINSNAKGIDLAAAVQTSGIFIWLKLLSLEQSSIFQTPCSAAVRFDCVIWLIIFTRLHDIYRISCGTIHARQCWPRVVVHIKHKPNNFSTCLCRGDF